MTSSPVPEPRFNFGPDMQRMQRKQPNADPTVHERRSAPVASARDSNRACTFCGERRDAQLTSFRGRTVCITCRIDAGEALSRTDDQVL